MWNTSKAKPFLNGRFFHLVTPCTHSRYFLKYCCCWLGLWRCKYLAIYNNGSNGSPQRSFRTTSSSSKNPPFSTFYNNCAIASLRVGWMLFNTGWLGVNKFASFTSVSDLLSCLHSFIEPKDARYELCVWYICIGICISMYISMWCSLVSI